MTRVNRRTNWNRKYRSFAEPRTGHATWAHWELKHESSTLRFLDLNLENGTFRTVWGKNQISKHETFLGKLSFGGFGFQQHHTVHLKETDSWGVYPMPGVCVNAAYRKAWTKRPIWSNVENLQQLWDDLHLIYDDSPMGMSWRIS